MPTATTKSLLLECGAACRTHCAVRSVEILRRPSGGLRMTTLKKVRQPTNVRSSESLQSRPKLPARGGGDGRQLRRQREAHVFANQIEVALIGEANLRKAVAHLLDQNFGRRSTGGEADALHAFEPFRIDVLRGVDQLCLHAAALCDFNEPIRIRAVRRTDDENEIDVLRNLFDGFL